MAGGNVTSIFLTSVFYLVCPVYYLLQLNPSLKFHSSMKISSCAAHQRRSLFKKILFCVAKSEQISMELAQCLCASLEQTTKASAALIFTAAVAPL